MNYVMFIIVLMFGVFVQAMVGFGGTMLAMPLAIMLVGLDLSKPVLTIVAWLTGAVVLVTEYKYINWRELIKMALVMIIGVVGGVLVTGKLQLNFLLIIYAVVIILVGVKKLFFPSKKDPSKTIQNISLAIAGIMQGLFVSGGSFLAVYSVATIKEKREFRATVNAVWALLNIIMIITMGISGSITKDVLLWAAISVVPTMVAIWLGGLLTKKVKQQTFLKVIYIILIVSGTVLLITNL